MITKEKRLLHVESPLGPDALHLRRFVGKESFSQPFEFDLELLATEEKIDPDKLLGRPIRFWAEADSVKLGEYHGLVCQLVAGRQKGGQRIYQAKVVPWLWFLGKRKGCRIFQGKSVIDIACSLFDELGFSDYEVALNEPPPSLEYCVQYRETDLQFLSRLFEEAGIFYYFRHEEDRHVLVLGDAVTAYRECIDSTVDYHPGAYDGPHLWKWDHGWSFISGKYAQRDFNFETPSADLTSEAETIVPLSGIDRFEIYDYPGEYSDGGIGAHLARRRMEQEEAEYDVVDAEGFCAGFFVAGRFTLRAAQLPEDDGRDHVITETRHVGVDPALLRSEEAESGFRVAFRCIPADVAFRPRRATPRPIVHGPQTAIVTGPGGEEVYSDEHGRIKVQFHWDREGKSDASSSCWVRVAQSWAGKRWGFQFMPRIGQEVVVEFLEGDPDRPLVVGSVYNAEHPPPYGPSESKTITGIRTRSTKGGGAEDFNEIRFDDKQGSELLFVHAQKDELHEVENDQQLEVGHDQSSTVGNDQSSSVGNDQSLSVGNDQTISVGRSRKEEITDDHTLSVGGSQSESIGKNRDVSIGKNLSESVSGAMVLSVDKNQTITVGGNSAQDVSGNHTLNVSKDSSTEVTGKKTLRVSKDHTVTVEGEQATKITKALKAQAKAMQFVADDEITIKTGDASIVLKKNGDITIKGKKITVNASGDLVLTGSTVTSN